ncbi:MAG: c-type cytochrome [Planctomycetota bacterium]
MRGSLVAVPSAWLLAVALASLQPQDPAPATGAAASQAARAQGAKVTFERVAAADSPKVVHSQRARLLSLAVERGETATPFLPPGMFRATFAATLGLPARDRCRFRIDGRGAVKLTVNGEVALDGALRAGKPLETAQPLRLKKGDNELVVAFESSAMGDGQFRLAWSGTDFAFEPIAPERLSSSADDTDVRAGEERRLGLQLFAERRCARCHEFDQRRVGESAFGELDVTGPDLRQAGARLHRDWIAQWLRDPRSFRSDAAMPKMALTGAECDDLAAWLAGLGSPPAAPPFATDAAAQGKDRFRQFGCVACHVAPGEHPGDGPLGARIALGHVPAKWQPMALVEYLQQPGRHHPHVRMPDLRLSLDEALPLAAFLLATAPAPLPVSRGDAARGEHAAKRHGCVTCHALDLPPAEQSWPRLRNLKPDRGCLADAPAGGGAPEHSFTAAQRSALRAFLAFANEAPFRRSPLDYVARHLEADRCVACHAFDGRPSVWARWAERASAATPLPKEHDPVAQGVPALTWTGSKLQPSWLERFVLGKEASPRPWLSARMPSFPHDGSAIAQGLVREHGYGPQDEPPVAADGQLAMAGEKLVGQGTGFDCVSCHALGDKPARQVFEREGIELLTARGRLRHEYYTRWLANPTRLDPDSRMPNFAPGGKSAFTEILGGDGAQQFEAIWQYLGGLRAGRR